MAESSDPRRKYVRRKKKDQESVSKDQNSLPANDVTPLLEGWEYQPGSINVRKVMGLDGLPKLQMRLDLGLLQMELIGRPDGSRPHGFESLLEFHERRLDEHRRAQGTTTGFQLSADQCQGLREESVMYYHRYLSLFVLEDYDGVVRDTARNLRVLDFCRKFADDDDDRLLMEQYRPYVLMMHTRASASLLVDDKKYDEALAVVKKGLKRIRRFFRQFGREEMYAKANEVRVLRRFARQIKAKMPQDPLQLLERKLNKAVEVEDYELAAILRDELERLRLA